MFEGETALPGNTPLSPDEIEALIPNLSTQDELNEWERENILAARAWALSSRRLKRNDPFTEPYIRKLHHEMFRRTWKWAGRYRSTEKNLGVAPHEIRERLGVFLGDARYWIAHDTFDIDEIAVRSHHALVVIHPFSNGNGRHARLFADVFAVRAGRQAFTWGRKEMTQIGPVREAYLRALRAADKGDFKKLMAFCRS
jgi:Fic-DOC domain mobile mystery protein B